MRPACCRAALLAAGLAAGAGAAEAQETVAAPHVAPTVFGVGGEFTAALSGPDRTAWFNYTDYDLDVLRIARLRLFGEWRPTRRWSVVGELRTENADTLTAAALYARWQVHDAPGLVVQVGRIPPVIGAFARHAYGRDNLVIGLPLAYQYLTSLRADALPSTIDELLRMRGRGWRPAYQVGASTDASGIPLISGSRWDTGVSTTWTHGRVQAAGAWTLGAPGVPVVRDRNRGRQASARLGAELPAGLAVGISAARGDWIDDEVRQLIPGGRNRPAAESVAGVDAEFGAGRWLVRHEWWQASYDVPLAADLSNLRLRARAGFVEARYRFHARWQVAARAERLAFSRVSDAQTAATSWDGDVNRLEVVLGLRASRRTEVRFGYQQNWRTAGRVRVGRYPTLAFIYWF